MDGVFVGVSRQALDEVLTYYGGPAGVTAGWSYQINHGPDGQEDWANLTTPTGQHVANIRTHHAIAIVQGLNAHPPVSGLEEAARAGALEEAVKRAQAVLADYIVPDSGITDTQVVNEMLGIFDDQAFVRLQRGF